MPTIIEPGLLKILVCPLTRSPLRQEGEELVGTVGGLRYPIREGIPILLVDEAKLPQGVASLDEFKKKFAGQIPA
ncbi:MAG: Trm112 family protein [Planctomycetes bacterium]|nr:Trm112 family protein [Planctomycetota bacterium]